MQVVFIMLMVGLIIYTVSWLTKLAIREFKAIERAVNDESDETGRKP